jgi:hypothetical protein
MVATRGGVPHRQCEQLALLPQHPKTEANDDEARDQRKVDLDPLWLQPRRAERRQEAYQDDSGGVGKGDEYAQNQGVDRLAARADNVSRGDRLTVTRRRGMHGANPKAGKNVKKHLLSRDRCASCPDDPLYHLERSRHSHVGPFRDDRRRIWRPGSPLSKRRARQWRLLP